MNKSDLKPDSLLVSAGRETQVSAPLNVPLVPASNYILGGDQGYSRDDATPTWEALEAIIGGLEEAHCVSFASGMAAIAAIFDQLPAGSLIALPDDFYQGVNGLAEQGEAKGLWQIERIATEDTEGWLNACQTADLIWLESPSNPLLKVAELDVICQTPRKAGALLAVDNTLATSLNQQPLALGADFSVQSATKFIGGHSDLLSGVVTTKSDDLADKLKRSRTLHGATPGALESFLAVRGTRTMAIRIERAQQNAIALAEWLAEHPFVTEVRYPGLSSHPTHAAAQRQLGGFGSLISFDVVGDAATADSVCQNVKVIHHATSLGAVESTMERRAAVPGQTHLPETLLRISVGIEHIADLKADLQQAFDSTLI